MDIARRLADYRERAETTLAHWLPGDDRAPARLHDAMRYAVLGGGKRLRPCLVYATADVLGLPLARVDGPAAAVELIHAYSLIHDDLPAMDDDDLRRGRPTCHRAFDEATAILAGDALQVLAFRILARDRHMTDDPALRVRMIDTLAEASGSHGMAGGQALDLAAEGRKDLSLTELERIHSHKTGALIHASVLLAAYSTPEMAPDRLDRLDRFGRCVGLGFQIQDDILDEMGDTETLGKTSGADRAREKPTYATLLGLDQARETALGLHRDAVEALSVFGEAAEPLNRLSEFVINRES